MPERHSVMMAVSSDSRSSIHPDAEYFRKRAKQCLLLADEATDEEVAMMLRRLAKAFTKKAQGLEA